MKYYVSFDDKIKYFNSVKSATNFAERLLKDDSIKDIEYGIFNGEDWDGHSMLVSLRAES